MVSDDKFVQDVAHEFEGLTGSERVPGPLVRSEVRFGGCGDPGGRVGDERSGRERASAPASRSSGSRRPAGSALSALKRRWILIRRIQNRQIAPFLPLFAQTCFAKRKQNSFCFFCDYGDNFFFSYFQCLFFK